MYIFECFILLHSSSTDDLSLRLTSFKNSKTCFKPRDEINLLILHRSLGMRHILTGNLRNAKIKACSVFPVFFYFLVQTESVWYKMGGVR